MFHKVTAFSLICRRFFRFFFLIDDKYWLQYKNFLELFARELRVNQVQNAFHLNFVLILNQ